MITEMANMIEAAKKQIDELVNTAYKTAADKGKLPSGCTLKGTVEIPKDTSHGDYACGYAMAAARDMKMPPRKIAEVLAEEICLENSFFESVSIAGAGFMNFKLSHKWFEEVLKEIEAEGDSYGNIDEGHGERVMVEFVSANPTGPMTIGNARGGVLGDTLASVLERAGYNVWREFYVNDAGNQVDLFGKSIEARYLQICLGEDAVEGLNVFLGEDGTVPEVHEGLLPVGDAFDGDFIPGGRGGQGQAERGLRQPFQFVGADFKGFGLVFPSEEDVDVVPAQEGESSGSSVGVQFPPLAPALHQPPCAPPWCAGR